MPPAARRLMRAAGGYDVGRSDIVNEVQGRLNIPVQPIAKQTAADRIKNWDETYFGFDLESAVVEANRCIQCPSAPCQEACPVHNDIPGAFALLEKGDIDGAANKFRETSNLPDMCGRLCPQEKLCEGNCVVGFAIRPGGVQEPPVTIGKLEAFVTDFQREALGGEPVPLIPAATGKRVAVIGSGPAGLAVAEELVKLGHACTVYEAWPEPGGVLVYGIPNFKMKKEIVDAKIAFLRRIGVEFRVNVWIGKDRSLDGLLNEGYDAVFLGTGAGVGNALKIPGEEMFSGIYAATDFLVRGNLEPDQLPAEQREPLILGRRVVVIGGGDTSMDCVRTARRLGSEEVTCIYRRTEAEMLGRAEERRNAREEGVRFEFLTVPLRFVGDDSGRVTGVECQRMELGAPDESGRRRPVPVAGSEYILPADTVAIAIGYNADPLIPSSTPGVKANRWHLLEVHPDTGQTSRPEVFAGGDNVNGADLVVTALADGRRAAAAMHAYLSR